MKPATPVRGFRPHSVFARSGTLIVYRDGREAGKLYPCNGVGFMLAIRAICQIYLACSYQLSCVNLMGVAVFLLPTRRDH